MKTVLLGTPFTEAQTQELRAFVNAQGYELITARPQQETPEQIAAAEIIIGFPKPAYLTKYGKELRWLQTFSAGVDAFVPEGVLPEDVLLTCATGAYGLGISEFAMGMLLAMMKTMPAYLEDRKAGVLKDNGPMDTIFGKRVLICGTGNLGTCFAERIAPFAGTVAGLKRRPADLRPPFDEFHLSDELKEEVGKADIIYLCLPGTKKTYHLFDRELLLACKEGSYLINVGRGSVVNDRALLDPEVSSRFKGIYLDVVEKEPIPDHDPLFDVPNLIVTPHITGGFHIPQTRDTIFAITMHNLKAWFGEGEFLNIVDREEGYAR